MPRLHPRKSLLATLLLSLLSLLHSLALAAPVAKRCGECGHSFVCPAFSPDCAQPSSAFAQLGCPEPACIPLSYEPYPTYSGLSSSAYGSASNIQLNNANRVQVDAGAIATPAAGSVTPEPTMAGELATQGAESGTSLADASAATQPPTKRDATTHSAPMSIEITAPSTENVVKTDVISKSGPSKRHERRSFPFTARLRKRFLGCRETKCSAFQVEPSTLLFKVQTKFRHMMRRKREKSSFETKASTAEPVKKTMPTLDYTYYSPRTDYYGPANRNVHDTDLYKPVGLYEPTNAYDCGFNDIEFQRDLTKQEIAPSASAIQDVEHSRRKRCAACTGGLPLKLFPNGVFGGKSVNLPFSSGEYPPVAALAATPTQKVIVNNINNVYIKVTELSPATLPTSIKATEPAASEASASPTLRAEVGAGVSAASPTEAAGPSPISAEPTI